MKRLTRIYALGMALLASMMFCVQAQAQNEVATLNHNGNLSSFYGANALAAAVAAADNGDVITLSAGEFNAADINKAITLRGAGVEKDDAAHKERTTINDVLYLVTPDANPTNAEMKIESIYCNGGLNVNSDFPKTTILKSRFSSVGSESKNNWNVEIIQSQVLSTLFVANNSTANVFNSVVGGIICSGGENTSSRSRFVNCLVKTESNVFKAEFLNCIFDGFSSPYSMTSSCTVDHCLAVGKEYYNDTFWDVMENLGCACAPGYGIYKAFNSPNSGYWYNTPVLNVELTDEAAAQYLGDDGTQVGIYGGFYPYDLTPNIPKISRLSVAKKTNEQGKLSVDISVSAQ